VKYAIAMRTEQLPSLSKYAIRMAMGQFPEVFLYWCHADDKFVYEDGPRTLYDSEEEAEGGILWIIGRKGPHYLGNVLEVREVKVGG
jgi:hypothetical protein